MSLKFTERLCIMTMKSDANFEEELTWHEEFDRFWPKHLKVSKIFISMGSFWARYTFFELKKYRGMIFHETEERYKIWRRIDLSFQNWLKEFDKIWPEHSKVSKIFILMSSFWAEEGYKIWKGIDFSFQNWHKEFDKIWSEHSKVSKFSI